MNFRFNPEGEQAICANSGIGLRKLEDFDSWTQLFPDRRVFMSEAGYNQLVWSSAMNQTNQNQAVAPTSSILPPTLTMVRDPTAHVLSQYFHCKESNSHRKRAHFMPDTLLEWLQGWQSIILEHKRKRMEIEQLERNSRGTDRFKRQLNRTIRRKKRAFKVKYLQHWLDPTFKCYIPVNFQSWLMGFVRDDRLFELTQDNQQPDFPADMVTKRDLAERFDVIGLVSQFELSYCLFMIHIFDGQVPDRCNCTKTGISSSSSSTSVPRSNISSIQQQVGTPAEGPTSTTKKEGVVDHGVQHHGSSYPLTPKERSLIYNLTRLDHTVYEYSVELFEEQIRRVERKYQIDLCREQASDGDIEKQEAQNQ